VGSSPGLGRMGRASAVLPAIHDLTITGQVVRRVTDVLPLQTFLGIYFSIFKTL